MNDTLLNTTINGSIAGGLGYIITLPIDSIKQNLQIGKSIKNINIQNYFKGGTLGLFSIIPQMAIKFTSNSYFEKKYNFNSYINGFIAGTLDGAFLGPILAVQSLQQINNKLTYKESLNMIKKKSIYNLCIPMALRNGFYTSIIIGSYKLIDNKQKSFLENFCYISLLNIPATVIASPFDVIRAIQCKLLLDNQRINVSYVIKKIIRDYGIKGFYKGYTIFYINFAIRFPLTFSIFNYISINSINIK